MSTPSTSTAVLGLIVGNRGFFPDHLAQSGREEMIRVLEAAGSRDSKALLAAFKTVDIKYGDPDLYVAKPNGLKFADDRLLEDGSAMFVQWMEDQSQQVLFPEQFANGQPRPRA